MGMSQFFTYPAGLRGWLLTTCSTAPLCVSLRGVRRTARKRVARQSPAGIPSPWATPPGYKGGIAYLADPEAL
jgi:hypothetical protein